MAKPKCPNCEVPMMPRLLAMVYDCLICGHSLSDRQAHIALQGATSSQDIIHLPSRAVRVDSGEINVGILTRNWRTL